MNQAMEKAEAIRKRKGKSPLTMLTAYDFPTAKILDEAGVDMLLVGDSVGMTLLGFPDTTHVTLDHMVHHVGAVARGAERALVIGDLPINTYRTVAEALASAHALVEAGAEAVKLEGGTAVEAQITAIVNAGIPVVAHIGLLPQKVLEEGGYKIKGKTDAEIANLMDDIDAVNRAGACCVVVEGTRPNAARLVTERSAIPTIAIGSGESTCDGCVAVITDLIGAFPWFVPGFIKPKGNVAAIVDQCAREWMDEIKAWSPPCTSQPD